MDMTEDQRRWWFATHPEYSWSRRGRRTGVSGLSDGSKTALANERLREALGHPAADPNSYDKYEDVLDRIWDYGKQQGFTENRDLFLWRARQQGLTEEQARDLWNKQEWTNLAYASAHNPLAALAAGVGGIRNALAKRAAAAAEREGPSRLGSLWDKLASSSRGQAASLTESGGPGKWVEVPRARHGLEHQSKMSGQVIRESGGKYYIKEYEVNGVKFDGYANGKLYEYKGRYSHLFDKDNQIQSWVSDPGQWRKQALDQVGAAKGIPVIWRVGADQVKAFKNAVENVPGISILP